MYSLECLIISFGFKDTPVYFIKDIMVILSPFLNWLVFLFLQKLVLRAKIDKAIVLNSITFIGFCNYPQIIQSIFPAVIYEKHDGVYYVQSDPKFSYYSRQQDIYRSILYVPVLTVLLIIFPVLFILFLRKNKKNLDDPNFKLKFGFIYQEYRQECYYIEFFKIGIKVVFMIIQSLFKEYVQFQISIFQQILTFYLVVIIKSRPYL